MAKKNKKYYLQPNEFFEEILESLRNDQISEKLGKMFYDLSEKYCNNNNFVRYVHIREDLISTGVIACCEAFTKFDPYNKLGLAVKNNLVKIDKEDKSKFHYTYKGEQVSFRYDDLKNHRPIIQEILDDYEEDGNVLLEWDGEPLEYDYKTCNNAFGFFTKVIHNSLILLLKKEYKQRNIFNKVKITEGYDPDYGYLEFIQKEQEKKDALAEEKEAAIEEEQQQQEVTNSVIEWEK